MPLFFDVTHTIHSRLRKNEAIRINNTHTHTYRYTNTQPCQTPINTHCIRPKEANRYLHHIHIYSRNNKKSDYRKQQICIFPYSRKAHHSWPQNVFCALCSSSCVFFRVTVCVFDSLWASAANMCWTASTHGRIDWLLLYVVFAAVSPYFWQIQMHAAVRWHQTKGRHINDQRYYELLLCICEPLFICVRFRQCQFLS